MQCRSSISAHAFRVSLNYSAGVPEYFMKYMKSAPPSSLLLFRLQYIACLISFTADQRQTYASLLTHATTRWAFAALAHNKTQMLATWRCGGMIVSGQSTFNKCWMLKALRPRRLTKCAAHILLNGSGPHCRQSDHRIHSACSAVGESLLLLHTTNANAGNMEV